MSKVIDFEAGLDTGEADADSIQAIGNGESIDQVTLGRPEQILRNRTEVLRAEANENRWIRDANQFMHVWITDGTITWDSTLGTLAFSSSFGLFLAPMANPGETRAAANEGAGVLWPSLYHFASFSDGVATNFVIQSKKFDFEGGFDITFTTVDDPGSGAIVVTVTGDASVTNPSTQPGRRDIVVTYDSTDTAYDDWDNIKAAVEADAIANPLVAITYAAADVTAFDTSVALAGGLDTVYHRITTAEMAAFFLASADNELQEGDTLAIWYDTPQLRRESVEENSNNHLITSGSLVNLTREPDKAANAILIGKVIRGSFHFCNGYVLWHQQPVARLEAGHALGTTLDTSSFTTLDNTSINLQEAWTDLDGVLGAGIAGADTVLRADLNAAIGSPPAPGAGASGAEHVGLETSTYDFITNTLETTQTVADNIDAGLNEFREWTRMRYYAVAQAHTGLVTEATATTVDVAAGTFTGLGTGASVRPALYATIAADTGLSTPGPNENYVVYADLALGTYAVTTETLWDKSLSKVALALVKVVASAIDIIHDVRDTILYEDITRAEYRVGASQRFTSIQGAIWAYNENVVLAAAASPPLTMPELEIVITDDITIDGVTLNSNNHINVPDNTTIRALPGATITINSFAAGLICFDLDTKSNITFRDLTFAFTGVTDATSILFGNAAVGGPTNLTLENITCLEGGTANATAGLFLKLTGGAPGKTRIINCELQGQDTVIDISGGGAADASAEVEIVGCQLANGTDAVGDGVPMVIDLYEAADKTGTILRIEGTRFGEAAAGNTGNFSQVSADHVYIDNCTFHGGLALSGTAAAIQAQITNSSWAFHSGMTALPLIDSASSALYLDSCTQSTFSNLSFNVAAGTLTFGADVTAGGVLRLDNSCIRCAVAGVQIDYYAGRAISLETTCTRNTLSDIVLTAAAAGNSRGVEMGAGSGQNIIRGVSSTGYDDEDTVYISSDNNLVTDMIVDQTTVPGTYGITDTGSGNLKVTGSIKVF